MNTSDLMKANDNDIWNLKTICNGDNMLECPYCGGIIEDDGLDCPHCGADLEEWLYGEDDK